ncbi:hypothetical protein [Nocardioides sp. Root151]|uniref:hypothetical protein n=1 Tax=Nocardioides sp. Root151 TaxID=1736475 RepID=UPI000702FAFC|nr:hypothetical protein [Nocardioides sp. Root151]KQZ67375.1 hypothetical protein ASD66_20720 [Nocardioides sp. Root151]
MSDPIKDLENFSSEGLPMNPLAPSEVRRRGDRIRRRNQGVLALGAAAAVAVVATSGVLVAGAVNQGEGPDPAVDPTQTTDRTTSGFLTTIPDDFALDVGMGGAQVTEDGQMDDLDYCGTTPLSDLPTLDVRSAEVSGGETSVTRTLYLLENQDEARATHVAVLDAARDCAAEKMPDGTVALQPADDSWPGNTITLDLGRGAETEPTVQVVNVVTNGPAVLVTSIWGVWSGDVQPGVETSRDGLGQLVPELDLFGDNVGPLEPSEVDPDQGSGSSDDVPTTIPDDYPLGTGWPDDSVAETEELGLQGPNRTLESLPFNACGETWQEPEYADRLRAEWTNAEDYRARQLTTYADADAAVAAVADLIAMMQACPEDPVRDDGYVTKRTVRKIPFGGEGWAILERDTLDGGDSPLGGSTMVIRNGLSVLVIRHDGHSGYPGTDNGQGQVDRQTSEASQAIAAMCRFTVAGCGSGSDGGTESSSDDVLGPDGWGELKIGMTAAELEATGLVTIAPADDPTAACRAVTIKGWEDTVHPNINGQVHAFVSKKHGLAMIFAQPGMRTAEGIGVGSTVADVRAAYGELGGQDAYNTAPVDGKSWFFLTDGGSVTAFQLEHADQDCMD